MPPKRRLEALRESLQARAAGWWRFAGDRLEQVAFVASGEVSQEIAVDFRDATHTVSLASTDLAIVEAATSGDVVISLASQLPAETGSGYWLRRFGAERSVAVPLRNETGAVAAVISVALDDHPNGDAVAREIRAAIAPHLYA